MTIDELKEKARLLRKHVIEMTTEAGSGHPSSSLSWAEIASALWFGASTTSERGLLRFDPASPDWPDRDRFILSKGHGCPTLYAALAEAGYFPVADLKTLRKFGSPLEGHPNAASGLPGVEASTGSLGQGLSIAAGIAVAGKLDKKDYRVYCLLGDGENDEGQVWEAVMFAKHHNLSNLTAIVDHNKAQQTGYVKDVLDLRPLADKWRAFGWDVREIDGHDMAQVMDALTWAKAGTGQPTAIIANTVKGKGVSFVEADYGYHGKALTKEEAARALEELGWA